MAHWLQKLPCAVSLFQLRLAYDKSVICLVLYTNTYLTSLKNLLALLPSLRPVSITITILFL